MGGHYIKRKWQLNTEGKRDSPRLPPILFLNVYTISPGILGICAQKGRQSGTCFRAESEQQGPWVLLYSSAGCLYHSVFCSCEAWQREDLRKLGRGRKAWDMQRKTNHVRTGEKGKTEWRRLNIRSKEKTAPQNGKKKSRAENSVLDSSHSAHFSYHLTE